MHQRQHQPQATYQHAKNRRIDFIFTTPKAMEAVTAAGTLAFNDGIQSDHRGLYIDLDTRKLLHGYINQLQSPEQRFLKTKDEKQTNKYIQVITDYMEQHNVFERIKEIEELPTSALRHTFIKQYEGIDNDIGRAMAAGEKAISTKHKGKIEWSPIFHAVRCLKAYWSERIKAIQTGRPNNTAIQHFKDQSQAQDDDTSDLLELKKRHLAAKARLDNIKTDKDKHQTAHLEKLTAHAEASNDLAAWKKSRHSNKSSEQKHNTVTGHSFDIT